MGGGGLEVVTTSAPPENFNRTLWCTSLLIKYVLAQKRQSEIPKLSEKLPRSTVATLRFITMNSISLESVTKFGPYHKSKHKILVGPRPRLLLTSV